MSQIVNRLLLAENTGSNKLISVFWITTDLILIMVINVGGIRCTLSCFRSVCKPCISFLHALTLGTYSGKLAPFSKLWGIEKQSLY